MTKKKVLLLASGRGSNASALYEAMQDGRINGIPVGLICDIPQAQIRQKEKEWDIPFFLVDRKEYPTKGEFNKKIKMQVDALHPDLICLAGFMRILDADFVRAYEGRIINIHPSLLPSFKGLHAQRQALEAGVKVAGCTVHFVTPAMDDGPIITQETVPVYETDTEDTLANRILVKEHLAFVHAVSLFCNDQLEICESRVVHRK
ncbi:phosphoribosylglycinamide formyltransferase [Megasphaera sp. UPII 135-E]|uniref:phosphoribosylglycinamide formyltransferase n=1 Tax=Megasphaera sp. UPII 135-E TaxID=1000569 RepID=UPI00021A38EC|nr:phosphoribosylglycinamide formyltransferase [Megasphaera sp. UPII 135-E]EGS32666.1 phosphoribosylglycinamide formyltransferase [Megasphaera sp. UPII 135-E]MUP48737.1 phosphoribosylglycinamide formyltransferase [Veillonellaceae bacterium M2-8]